LTTDLVASIRLGCEVEADDPNIAFELPPDDEVRWLAAWLVSEGWTRPRSGRTTEGESFSARQARADRGV
jgi:hypothetical protein